MGHKCISGRNEGILKKLQANMGMQPGEFRQSRKKPFIGINAVRGEADLRLAPGGQGAGPFFERLESPQQRVHIGEQRPACLVDSCPSAHQLEETDSNLLLQAIEGVADGGLAAV